MSEHSSLTDAVLRFSLYADRLKSEIRHSWLSGGRRESVAEHSWHAAVLVLLLEDTLRASVDVSRVLRLVLVHDLAEAITGDVPVLDQDGSPSGVEARRRAESEAMSSMASELGSSGQYLYELWNEFDQAETPEAMVAAALDDIEAQLQRNLADLSTWEPAEYELTYSRVGRHVDDRGPLRALVDAVVADAERRWRDAGIDPTVVRARSTAPHQPR